MDFKHFDDMAVEFDAFHVLNYTHLSSGVNYFRIKPVLRVHAIPAREFGEEDATMSAFDFTNP